MGSQERKVADSTNVVPAIVNATIVVKGVFSHEGDFDEFLYTLKDSELSKGHHHTRDMQIDYGDQEIKVTLYFKDIVDFLIKSSFKDGMLRHWGKQFTITYPVLTT